MVQQRPLNAGLTCNHGSADYIFVLYLIFIRLMPHTHTHTQTKYRSVLFLTCFPVYVLMPTCPHRAIVNLGHMPDHITDTVACIYIHLINIVMVMLTLLNQTFVLGIQPASTSTQCAVDPMCVPIALLSTQFAVDPMCGPIELLSTQCAVDPMCPHRAIVNPVHC